MNVIDPIAVTDAMLTSSVPENDYPLWNPGTTYVKGARVLQVGAHSVFESVVNSNLGNDPVITSPGKWIAIRATNRWAMFDDAVGSSTSATGQIVVTLAPGVPVAAIGVLDTDAATVRVQIKVGSVAHHDETREVPSGGDEPASLLFLDLPMDPAGVITITLAGATPSAPVSVGTLVFGALIDLGVTEAGPSVGINDFSRRETDDFGVTTVVERAWAKRMTVRSLIATSEVDAVQRQLAALRARPSLWIGDAGFESLCIYGYFKDFSIDLALETISYCSLTIEGLTKAQELLSVESGLAAILTNEMHTLPSDSAGDVTSYAGAAGEFKIFAGTEDVSVHFELSSQDNPQDLAVAYSGQSYAITGGLDAAEPSATLTIRAMGTGPFSGLTIDKVFSLAKASAGANGADGANGANAKTLTLLSDRQTIAYDAAGAPSPTEQTTTFSTNRQNTTATVNWSVTDATGTARTPVTSYLSAATGDSVTMTEAQFAAARNGTAGVIVTASVSDGGTIMDRISVVRVQAGAKGDTGPKGDPGSKGDKGDTGAKGFDAIAYVQEGAPGAPSSSNQLWYKPSTKQFFRWNGSVWVEMLGTLSQYDQIVTSLIKVDTIHASHFITDQGVDLASIVPGTFNWRAALVDGTAIGPSRVIDTGIVALGATGAVTPATVVSIVETVQSGWASGGVGIDVTGDGWPDYYESWSSQFEIYYRINGGAWIDTGIRQVFGSHNSASGGGNFYWNSGPNVGGNKFSPWAAGFMQIGVRWLGSHAYATGSGSIYSRIVRFEIVNWK